jgi:hypothetical protein
MKKDLTQLRDRTMAAKVEKPETRELSLDERQLNSEAKC